MKDTIAVLTSGGDGPGMNAAVRAVVRTSVALGYDVVGVKKGFEGLINGLFEELDIRSVGNTLNRGGTFIQTARSPRFKTEEGRKLAYANMASRGIKKLIVIGGDGSFRGLNDVLVETGIQGIGVPGTIDNDVYGTEYTIGYDTALNTAMECIDKIRDTATSHDRLFVIEVMGRNSGYLAMYTGISCGAEGVFIPENKDEYPLILERLKEGREKGKKSFIIIVAEGDELGGGFAIKEMLQKDLGDSWNIRVSILGHLQRGGSPSALDRIVASRLGYEAVLALDKGMSGVIVGYTSMNDCVNYVPLKDTWEKKKTISERTTDMFDKLSL
ncbi:MAG: 6-phosphofructokinase [Candidatus Margulisbacteria bacterium]|nr:6-phosphofructokinase [Candidatus Margulisiibacteriota bacterium]